MTPSWLPASVKLVEVGPRDGLQNEPQSVPVSTRVSLIEMLVQAGLTSIECGSFVSLARIPQMSSTAEIFAQLRRREGVRYSALVPNLRGLEAAAAARVDEISVFLSASEAFSQSNINCSIDESLSRANEVLLAAQEIGLPVRGYVSCVLGCPFQGAVPLAAVARVSAELHAMGCYEISLGDTIGIGTPLKARSMLQAVAQVVPLDRLAVHYHDTWGQALANILASLEVGVSVIDSSVAGLGGCPFAPGAAGNVATEDVLYLLEGMGIRTGVQLDLVAAAGRMICGVLGRQSSSKAARALASSLSQAPSPG